MAQYMTGQQLAAYNESIANSGDRVLENITDTGTGDINYDYDGDQWIFYGDYWVKPDGTISYDPPVMPPILPPTTPQQPGTAEEDYYEEEEEDYEDPFYEEDYTPREREVTAWNDWYKNTRKPRGNIFTNLGDYVYGTGDYIAQGWGMDPTEYERWRLGGELLVGGIGGLLGANAAPWASDLISDARDKREYEQERDILESLGLRYKDERIMGNALVDYRNGLIRDTSTQAAAEREAIKEAAVLFNAVSDQEWYDRNGRDAAINYINENLALQGYGPLSYDPQYLDGLRTDYANMFGNMWNSTSVAPNYNSTRPYTDARDQVGYTGPNPNNVTTGYNPFNYGLTYDQEQERIQQEQARLRAEESSRRVQEEMARRAAEQAQREKGKDYGNDNVFYDYNNDGYDDSEYESDDSYMYEDGGQYDRLANDGNGWYIEDEPDWDNLTDEEWEKEFDKIFGSN